MKVLTNLGVKRMQVFPQYNRYCHLKHIINFLPPDYPKGDRVVKAHCFENYEVHARGFESRHRNH